MTLLLAKQSIKGSKTAMGIETAEEGRRESGKP
jgi:hypothetical protein